MHYVDDKNHWPRWFLAGDHRVSSRSVIAKREGHDHRGQRVYGRSVRPRVDNYDHRGQRVFEGSALAVLYSNDIYIGLHMGNIAKHFNVDTIYALLLSQLFYDNVHDAVFTAIWGDKTLYDSKQYLRFNSLLKIKLITEDNSKTMHKPVICPHLNLPLVTFIRRSTTFLNKIWTFWFAHVLFSWVNQTKSWMVFRLLFSVG